MIQVDLDDSWQTSVSNVRMYGLTDNANPRVALWLKMVEEDKRWQWNGESFYFGFYDLNVQ